MSNFPITGSDVLKYIPQRHPFVLVDTLLECSSDSALSAFSIPENHLLTESGKLSAEGLCENIAQTGALLSGYSAEVQGRKAPVGFIGAVKGFQITSLPDTGTQIKTEVRHQTIIGSIIVVQGKVWSGNDLIAEAEMKIFLQTES